MPWKLPVDDGELLELAKSYPYSAPGRSYLFADGAVHRLDGASFDDRVAVVAHGSNRSPAQLRRKFGSRAEIPVTYGWLADYDVVYSAHITQYGAVASTLCHRPGTRVRVAVTWLDETQLRRMHETEGPSNYSFGRLAGIELVKEAGPLARCGEAYVYLGRKGYLDHDGAPVGLAALNAHGRFHRATDQRETLSLVRARHRPHLGLDEMILGAIRDAGARRALSEEMQARAIPAAAPHFEPVDE